MWETYMTWREGVFQCEVQAKSDADAIKIAAKKMGFAITDKDEEGKWEVENLGEDTDEY